METKVRNGLIALVLGGGIILAGRITTAMVPGLDITANTLVMGLVAGSGTFAALNVRAGNRRQPVASNQARAAALTFPRKTGAGYVVVLRGSRSARSVGFDVLLDGANVAQLMPLQFVVLPIAAGPHELFADIPGAPGKSAAEPVDATVGDGEVLFLETRTKIGLTRTSVHLDTQHDTTDLRRRLGQASMVMPLGA